MEEFSKLANLTTKLTIVQAFIAIFLTFILTIIITQVYKRTHKGNNYSQSFVHTIIIMGVVVSIIMIVIGNNVAVAFGLVGAFSIIRFRSAMADPKDIAFIFFGMAAGIACGLGFYLLAILFTVSLSILIYILFLFNYGRRGEATKSLKITVPENLHYENLFDDIFEKYLETYSLQKVETTNLGTMIQMEYLINNKTDVSDKVIIDEIRERNANLKVSMNYVKYEGK
ncbi:cell division protein FtsZ [Bacillus sp. LL01]|nr:cell division protein FtsZ [Bacillus sp. LL01]